MKFKSVEELKVDGEKIVKNMFSEGTAGFEEIKSHFFKILPFWIAGAITAIVSTAYAKIFVFIEKASLHLFEAIGYWYALVAPCLFFLSWYVVEKLSPYANGSGIPQLMVASELHQTSSDKSLVDKLLGIKVIVVKIISSLLMVLGGGAIGREGPTLQISGSIFHLVGKVFTKLRDPKSRYGLVLAGGAAGLASSFNTPLGGIAYVVEELSKSHLSSFRTGVLHAIIVAGLISQLIMGPYLYLGYPKTGVFEYRLLGVVVILAMLSSLIVTLFSQSLKWIVQFRAKLSNFLPRAMFAIVCGFCFVAMVYLVSPIGMGSGKEFLNKILFESEAAKISDIVARFLGSLLTYSAGGAGGIFAPTLSLGGASSSFFDAMLGSNIGPLATLIGMTAGLAALTHSPLTSFILILEMTDRHSSIFALMIAAVIGHGISKLISKTSFYEFVYERLIDKFHEQESKNNEN